MQTQSISFQVSAVQARTSATTAKETDKGFDRIMSDNVSKASTKKEAVSYKDDSASVSKETKKEVVSSSDEYQQHKITVKDKTVSDTELEHVDAEVVEEQVITLLQDTFGLSEEDIVDLLQQLGLTPMDLAIAVSKDSIQITPINMENIKALVMEVHGIADANVFLTSGQMSDELNQIANGIEDILTKELGVHLEQLTQDDTMLMQSFAEKWDALLQGKKQSEGKVVAREDDNFVVAEAVGDGDEIPVVVENATESGTQESSENATQMSTDSQTQTDVNPADESPIQVFAERLEQSLADGEQSNAASNRVTMNSIVEQVVRHVRIRVLPQTTSMELQLNPESLGRVNLRVLSQNGVATATLTVQNEVAKEALESQLAVLKENFENHGLKVENVEVNVAEFTFKQQEDSNQQGFQRKKSGNRRFRDVTVDTSEEVEESTQETDGRSVVDYTA